MSCESSTRPPRQSQPAVTALPRDARQIPHFPGFWISRRGDVFSFWQYKRFGRKKGINKKGVEKILSDVPHKLAAGFHNGNRRVFLQQDGVRTTRTIESLLMTVFGD